MKFGPVPLSAAAGAILAHSRPAGGRMLRKGRVLDAGDVALLQAEGCRDITVARLEAGDIGEDEAARTLADALAAPGLCPDPPSAGRCNLRAGQAGLCLPDGAGIDRLNRIDEGLAVATLDSHASVRPGQILATIKIMPFALPAGTVQAALAVGRGLLRLAPFHRRSVALVQTRLSGTAQKLLDKTESVTRERLARLEQALDACEIVPHDTAALAACLTRHREGLAARTGDRGLLLLSGASAVVDRADVVPAAIVAAGGTVSHFGMPVDPGNLLLLGTLDGTPVIGMPGCARSPKANGFDRVLTRILADLPVGRQEITGMGVGGLLADTPARPWPRATPSGATPSGATLSDATPSRATPSGATPASRDDAFPAAGSPRLAALILAAGRSRRMGEANKLLSPVAGKPMIRHAVEAALAAATAPVLVVTGHQAAALRAALAGCPVRFVHNPDYRDGLSRSLAAGLQAVPGSCAGVVVMPGDMPLVGPADLERLLAAWRPEAGQTIVVPEWQGQRGNPVLWDRRFFQEMCQIRGDAGARHLLKVYDEQVVTVPMATDAVATDVDTPAALAAVAARLDKSRDKSRGEKGDDP